MLHESLAVEEEISRTAPRSSAPAEVTRRRWARLFSFESFEKPTSTEAELFCFAEKGGREGGRSEVKRRSSRVFSGTMRVSVMKKNETRKCGDVTGHVGHIRAAFISCSI
ncbi:hypothetical protein CEXT_778201 [Caerostris extrusa]|uniref:Uncharacterized protein n=1 Tax=Caerostris extrusa TaxID=172846 RepID=A0AAV4RAA9_CAEEX|nr:hypothetical protein CEXT_778201 [Caerostris extrusa]